MLGLASSLVKGGASLLTFVKDNLKLYLDFKSSRSDTLAFPSEGSTSFDGDNDYIDFGDISLTGEFTLACWINRDDTDSQVVWGDSANADWFRLTSATTADIKIANNSKNLWTHGATFSSNEWEHLAVVRDSSDQITIYRNGIHYTSNAPTRSGTFVPEYLGQKDSGGYFDGKMVNNAIWSRALSTEEVNSVMNKSYSQLGSVEKTSLEAWWALDSAVGGAVTPASGETLGSELFTNGWTNDGNGSSYPPYSGSFSYDASANTVTATSGSSGTYVSNETFRTEFTAVANALYKISFTTANTNGTTQIRGLSSANHLDTGTSTPYLSSTYSLSVDGEQVFYVKANASATRYIGFRSGGSNRSITVSNFSIKKVTSNTGLVTGATTTTSVYGGNAPILPRAIDIAESFADAIGNGSALFNGTTDIIDIGSNSILDNVFVGGATVMAWIKPSSGGENDIGRIFDKSDATSGDEGWHFIVRSESGGVCDLRFTHGWSTTKGRWDTDNREVNINEWNHVAITYDNSSVSNNASIFVNGISVTVDETATPSGTVVDDSSQNLFIGNNTGKERTFDGSIASAGIWRGALTQAQIQSVMESTSYAKIPASVKSTLGSDQVTNGTFDTDANWTKGTGWSINTSTKKAVCDGTQTGNTGLVQQGTISGANLDFEVGKTYKLTFDVTTTAGAISYIEIGGTTDHTDVPASDNTATRYITATSTNDRLTIAGNSTFEGTIDNVVVKEVINDLVAYYPLDADNSANGVTQNATTGETLSSEKFGTADNDWTFSSSYASISNGVLSYTGSGVDNANMTYSGSTYGAFTFATGKLYKLVFTVANTTGGKFKVQTSTSATILVASTVYSSGTYTFYLLATSTHNGQNFQIRGEWTGANFDITSISFKEVTSNTGVLK
jgi:hypothetical protein